VLAATISTWVSAMTDQTLMVIVLALIWFLLVRLVLLGYLVPAIRQCRPQTRLWNGLTFFAELVANTLFYVILFQAMALAFATLGGGQVLQSYVFWFDVAAVLALAIAILNGPDLSFALSATPKRDLLLADARDKAD
jgi:hypothetical protein